MITEMTRDFAHITPSTIQAVASGVLGNLPTTKGVHHEGQVFQLAEQRTVKCGTVSKASL